MTLIQDRPQADAAESHLAEAQRQRAMQRPLPEHTHIAILGSGFAGLGMAIKLREMGVNDFLVLERATDVGGTWRDNSYPGAACDVPSQLYSFSFALKPDWSRSFSPQPEIYAYLQEVTTDRQLWPQIALDCEVTGASWDAELGRWRVETARGSLTCDILLPAVGALSEPSIPDLPGLSRFRGKIFHSAQWDHDYNLVGKRVAVVGTGASAIQFVPQVAEQVQRMTVFQRTPPWIIPRWDRNLTKLEKKAYTRFPALQRFARNAIYWGRETYAVGFTKNTKLLSIPEQMGRALIRRQVPDPELREKVTPDYRIGCKRILISNEWYPALMRSNVDVETSGIAEVTETGICTKDGRLIEVDAILFGTGFAVNDWPMAKWARGDGGRTLKDVWGGKMASYRGTTVAGFPNMMLLVGPNTGLGHTSQVYMIEAQIAYIADAIRQMHENNWAVIEPKSDAQWEFDESVQRRMKKTVWVTGGCSSWYIDDEGRNTTLWPDFTFRFKRQMKKFDAAAYHVTTSDELRERSHQPQQASQVRAKAS